MIASVYVVMMKLRGAKAREAGRFRQRVRARSFLKFLRNAYGGCIESVDVVKRDGVRCANQRHAFQKRNR